jgi:AraC-like DNA-binding protein
MRLHIATTDPEEAHDWLRSAYVDHSVRLSGRRRAFRFSHRLADCGVFKVGVARHTMTLHGDWSPLGDVLLFSELLSGRFTISSSRSEVAAGAGDAFSYDPDTMNSVEWSDIRMAQVRMDRVAVDRVAAELTGDDTATGPIGFELARPVSAAKAQHWKRLMQYVACDVAPNPAVHGSPLVLRQVFRLIVASALETFPNTTLTRDGRTPGRMSAQSVRRAVAFIEEHAGEDIDLTDVAEAVRVGPRALQRAFRGSLATTPSGYLRTVRMQRAHQDLTSAAPGDGATVAGIASRWGFGHPGRFATDYRARFGRSPSETLRS